MASTPAPFWKDDPETPSTSHLMGRATKLITITFVIRFILVIAGAFAFFYFVLSKVLAFGWLFLMLYSLGLGFYRRRQLQRQEQEIALLKQRAREKTGASFIGSAVHVAGHPLLEREQPVVLALSSEGLGIYPYDRPVPLDTLTAGQMLRIATVVYDDERIPHLDTVDSTAQALQLTVEIQGQEFTVLFRRMRSVRPIDWYHALQKSRLQTGSSPPALRT